MNKLPFVIPEYDLGVRMSRILLIICQLSHQANLTPEKIGIFEFLVKHPHILSKLLIAEGKNGIDLRENETGSIESQFPNVLSLLDYGVIRGVLRLLLCYDFIEVRPSEEISYRVTEKGLKWTEQLETSYLLRIKELCDAAMPIRKLSNNQLIKKIKPFVQGV